MPMHSERRVIWNFPLVGHLSIVCPADRDCDRSGTPMRPFAQDLGLFEGVSGASADFRAKLDKDLATIFKKFWQRVHLSKLVSGIQLRIKFIFFL